MDKSNKGLRQLLGWPALILVLVAAGGVWYLLDPGFRSAGEATSLSATATAAEADDDFGRRVREYLLANPEVIVEAMQTLEIRRQRAENTEAQAALAARTDDVFRDPGSPVGGNADGDVTMVEFFDYNCPYCRQVAPVMAEAVAADPGLRIVYKEFPILGPGSIFAAKAALAAERQGKYGEFHEALMNAESRVEETTVLAIAEEIGLDVERLKEDIEDPAIQAEIDANLELAQALRINGTPGFVIGDEILRGATDLATMQELIAKARSDGGASGETSTGTAN